MTVCFFGCGRDTDGTKKDYGDCKQSCGNCDCGCPLQGGHVGSSGCRDCHARFYELWATSHHGLAMQPFTRRLAEEELTPLAEEVKMGENFYRVDIAGDKLSLGKDGEFEGHMFQRGPGGERQYKIEHVLGGKNVYYFLTPTERGRWQVLPLAYDVRRKQWYNTTASAVRHFVGQADEALDWTEREYTFNTSCYDCHVSLLSTNYDPKTDSYNTVWGEPGINCETCHGSAKEHVRVCRDAADKGAVPADLKLDLIVQDRGYTAHQVNSACSPCHAKMTPISDDFQPGDSYFDHFDLTGFEHPDFYPDGRDLGENYTYTLWRMNPCAKAGKLDCVHCHTSSGRYRHKDDPNQSCLPCHRERVENVVAHSHHEADGPGSHCISCHMPMTEFARMRRSDHSMLPPTPAATLKFKSPNACNICHKDKDAAWADKYVRQWHKDDYQRPVLHRAELVDAARKQDWPRLPEMLDYLKRKDHEEITAVSLVRLLAPALADESRSKEIRPVISDRLQNDPSPLVRSAAADALANNVDGPSLEALLDALDDDYRLVRIRAAAALATVPEDIIPAAARGSLERATGEFEAAMRVRPDDSASQYNLGNYYMNRGMFAKAAGAFQRSVELDPRMVRAMVNASLVYSMMGDNKKAEAILRRALSTEPDCAAVNFNLGLLLGEMGRVQEAEKLLRRALKTDPKFAAAAHNLGVILSAREPGESVRWCEKAAELAPQNAKYAYTAAFYQDKSGDEADALKTLTGAIERGAADAAVYDLLGRIYQRRNENAKAALVYRRAAADVRLSREQRHRFEAMAEQLTAD